MTFEMFLGLCGIIVFAAGLLAYLLKALKREPLIVISNHVKAIGMPYPSGALIRINVAWIKSADDVQQIIKDVRPHNVYLDYPTGRTKPPRPTLTLKEAQDIANSFAGDVTHFAFSNAWDAAKPKFIAKMRESVAANIKLVPKIETKGGVDHLKEIVDAAKTDMVMLDAEDLYVACKHNPKIFEQYKAKCRKRCKELGVTCIELKGVVFGYEA